MSEPIDDLYSRRILSLAAALSRLGRLPAPDTSARAVSRLCGSEVTVDLKVTDGVVTDFAHEVKACALGQASSAVMARNVIGASEAELRLVREVMRRMLKEGGPPPGEGLPEGKWADLRALEPVRDYRARHASTMLTFDAVIRALDDLAERRKSQDHASPLLDHPPPSTR